MRLPWLTSFAQSIPFGPGGGSSRAVAAGDLNGDGHVDWLVGNIGTANAIYFGDGSGAASHSREFGRPDGLTYAIALATR